MSNLMQKLSEAVELLAGFPNGVFRTVDRCYKC